LVYDFSFKEFSAWNTNNHTIFSSETNYPSLMLIGIAAVVVFLQNWFSKKLKM
jgi:hypothetical protein